MDTCKTNKYFRKTRLTTHIMLLILRILRSSTLNIILFLLGFSCGFLYVSTTVHHNAYQNEDYGSIIKIKEYLNCQRKMDRCIDDEIKKLEHKMSHDEHEICKDVPFLNN